jgi:hypothetical protein
MVQALYMEWELPTPQGDGPTLDLAAGLGGGMQDRLEGSRGVHASFWLQDGARLALIMLVDSPRMREAYAYWSRLRVHLIAGVTPSRQETFGLLGAVEGAAGLAGVLRFRHAA